MHINKDCLILDTKTFFREIYFVNKYAMRITETKENFVFKSVKTCETSANRFGLLCRNSGSSWIVMIKVVNKYFRGDQRWLQLNIALKIKRGRMYIFQIRNEH